MYFYISQQILDKIELPNGTSYFDLQSCYSEIFLGSARMSVDDNIFTEYSITSLPKSLRSPLWECYLNTVIKHRPNKNYV